MKTAWIAALVALTAAGPALARPAPAAPVAEAPPARAKGLVFALTTGLEDPMQAVAALRHARVVLTEGGAERATVVISGRATVYLLPGYTMPADLQTELDAAKQAGVRVVVCEHALGRFGVPVEHAATMVEVVPKAILEIAALVAQGHEVLNY